MTTALASDVPPKSTKKVLFFSKSSGFEHEGIKLKMKDGRPGFAFAILTELGAKDAVDFTFSKDGSLFTPDYLAQFDAFVFYSTGDLTLPKNTPALGDGNPPMTPDGKAALLAAIESGKGFVGIHCAVDTFHSPGNRDDNTPARYVTDGDNADPYIRMLGGEFIKHDAPQAAHQMVVDAKFPGFGAVPSDFGPNEEWYSLKNFPADLHVLLVQDTHGMRGAAYVREPFPSTWARRQGRGRVFFTSMGHREEVWTNPVFQSIMLGGLDWALRRVDADLTPNLAKVAPQANALPKFPGAPPVRPPNPSPPVPAAGK